MLSYLLLICISPPFMSHHHHHLHFYFAITTITSTFTCFAFSYLFCFFESLANLVRTCDTLAGRQDSLFFLLHVGSILTYSNLCYFDHVLLQAISDQVLLHHFRETSSATFTTLASGTNHLAQHHGRG